MSEGSLLGHEGTVVVTIVVLTIIWFIKWLFAGKSSSRTAREIGTVVCQRCGHSAPTEAATRFKPFQGMSTTYACERCGSEDWRAA